MGMRVFIYFLTWSSSANHFQLIPRLSSETMSSGGMRVAWVCDSVKIVGFLYFSFRIERAASTRATRVRELRSKSGPRRAALVAQKLSSGTGIKGLDGPRESTSTAESNRELGLAFALLLFLLNAVPDGLGGIPVDGRIVVPSLLLLKVVPHGDGGIAVDGRMVAVPC